MMAEKWLQVQTIFHEALTLTEAERGAFVATACADDAEIFHEVQHMLEADSRAESILDLGLPELAYQMIGAPILPITGDKVGPYRLVRRLGEGGMGVVCLVERADTGKQSAMKFLIGAGMSPARRTLFTHEIRTHARLSHPSIAAQYDAGTLPDGTPWFVMEYVPGRHFVEYCEAQNMGLKSRLELFIQVCKALEYLHSKGIIHSDLKSSNILVDEGGVPKVLDFGIAKELGAVDEGEQSGDPHLRMMTRVYAAPEFVEHGFVDQSTDVYSLGVIFYEMLAGLHAPRGDLSQTGKIPNVGKAAWRELSKICRKALEADAAKRYASVQALRQDIDHFLGGKPLAGVAGSRWYRLERFVTRNRLAVFAASVAILLFVAMAAVFTVRLAHERNAALAEAARTRRIQQFTLDLLGNNDQQAAPSKDLTVIAALDRGGASVASLKSDPETQAELYLTLGRLYEQLNRMPKAEELLQLALAKAKTLGANSRLTVNILVQLGVLRGDEAQFADAKRLIHEGLDVSRRLHLSPDDPGVVNARAELGKVLVQAGQYDEAIALLTPITKRAPSSEEDMVNLLESMNYLAVAEQYLGRYREAESLNRRALALDRDVHGGAHPRVAEDLANIATAEATLAHYSEAEDLYRQAAGILEAWYGPDNAETVQVKSFVGLVAMQGGKNKEAEELLRNVLPVQERALGTKVHPSIALTHDSLAKLALRKGDLSTAEAEMAQSAAILTKLLGERDPKTAIANNDLADVFLREGRYELAERTVRPAVKILTERPMPGNMSVGLAELTLGEAILKQSRYQDAVGPLLAAHDVFKDGPSAAMGKKLQQVRQDLVAAYQALRQTDKASVLRKEMESAQVAK